MYLNTTYDLGIGVDEISILTNLYSVICGLQPSNERDTRDDIPSCSSGHQGDFDYTLDTRRTDPEPPMDVQLNLEEASVNFQPQQNIECDLLNMHSSLLNYLYFMHNTTCQLCNLPNIH